MKRITIILAILKLLSIETLAVNQTDVISDDSTTIDVVQALAREVAVKQQLIDQLNDSIFMLTSNYEKELSRLQEHLSDLSSQIRQQEEIKKARESVDSVVFRQCLLYPLERPYSASLINQAQRSLTVLGIWDNPKFKSICDIYADLLRHYGDYNRELTELLESKTHLFERMSWTINGTSIEGFRASLRKLSYYTFYIHHNEKPWRSIIYLDEVIDDILKMLDKGPQFVTSERMQELKDRLKPRNR